jgi:hypothetical protein
MGILFLKKKEKKERKKERKKENLLAPFLCRKCGGGTF